jgi:hypothetical protein
MLGEEEFKTCNVRDDLIEWENCNLEEDDGEDTPFFDTEHDLSYEENNDGEVKEVRTRKTENVVSMRVLKCKKLSLFRLLLTFFSYIGFY